MDIRPSDVDDRPKVIFQGKMYRLHKPLGDDEVRLETLDGMGIVDVPTVEIEHCGRGPKFPRRGGGPTACGVSRAQKILGGGQKLKVFVKKLPEVF